MRPGTDAGSKLHPGDQVLGYNKFGVNRTDFWKMNYYLDHLAPQKASMLEIREPNGQSQQLTIDAKVRELKRVVDLAGTRRRRRSLGHDWREEQIPITSFANAGWMLAT